VLKNPDLIWPDLRILLPVQTPDAAIEPPVAEPFRAAAVQPRVTPTPTSEPAAIATLSPNESKRGGKGEQRPCGSGGQTPQIPVVPPPAEAPVRAVPGETPVQHWPGVVDGRIAGGAAAYRRSQCGQSSGRCRARRRVSRPLEPENDTRVDAGDFTLANPPPCWRRGVVGVTIPRHRAWRAHAAEILRRAARAGLTDVQVVTVDAGRTHSDVALATPLANRSGLETTLRAAADLAGRVTLRVSREQDVVVRLEVFGVEAIGGLGGGMRVRWLLCLGLRLDLERGWWGGKRSGMS